MTADILPLTKPAEPAKTEPAPNRIWTCVHCGCQTFYLYEDASTECALCKFHDATPEGGWREQIKETHDVEHLEPKKVVNHGATDFALASITRLIDTTTAAVIVVWEHDQVKTWSSIDSESTPEQKTWIRDRLLVASDLITGPK